MRRRIAFALLAAGVTACGDAGRRAQPSVDSAATEALPRVGTRLRPFNYPTAGGRASVSTENLAGQPALLALWSADEPESPAAMTEFEALENAGENSGIRFVVLANHKDDARLDTLLRGTNWGRRADYFGIAYNNLRSVFDASSRGADRIDPNRTGFRLPSFVLVGPDGRVLRRAAGMPFATMKPAIDSIKAVYRAAAAHADSQFVDSIRPHIEAALAKFDPSTLEAPDTLITLEGTCGSEGQPDKAVIPARVRVLSMNGNRYTLYAQVELTSVAALEPIDEEYACEARQLTVTPRVKVDTTGVIWPGGPGRKYITEDFVESVAVMPLRSDASRTLVFPPGVTAADLRARIDSIRGKP